MSTHQISTVRIGPVLPHENADSLELTTAYGWQCCVKKGAYKEGDLVLFVPPDFLVPTERQEFAFLAPRGKNGKARISAMRLRGTMSFGLIIPAPEGATEGEDFMERLGIERYEPCMDVRMGGNHAPAPSCNPPKFDLENLERYIGEFMEGEAVIATEKVHGTNARYVWEDGKLHCGSRNGWMVYGSGDVWSEVASRTTSIGEFCEANPGVVLFGEIFGPIQDLKYGRKNPEFIAFAAMNTRTGIFWNFDIFEEQCKANGVQLVPVIYAGPFNATTLRHCAEQDSKVSSVKQISEGVVVVPMTERVSPAVGRVSLKLVSFRYLSR